jgi:hypothetical protein
LIGRTVDRQIEADEPFLTAFRLENRPDVEHTLPMQGFTVRFRDYEPLLAYNASSSFILPIKT